MSENSNISLDKAEVSDYRLTPFETFIKFLVASFIWGGLFFVPGFIIGILKSFGIIIGMIPTILIYAPFGYLIKKSTEKWFRYYKERRSKKHQKQSSTENLVLQDDSNCTKENDIEKFNEEQEADVQSSNESSVKLNYKEAKKVAREEYKEKKKELKSKHKNQNLKGYKIATIVLSILLLGATIVNIAQFIYYEEYTDELFHEKLDLETEIRDLQCHIEALEEQAENLTDDESFSLDDIDLNDYEIIE